jgi:hypothetical protein
MAVGVAATAAAMAKAKTVAEGVGATLAPTSLGTTGAGNGRGKQQSTKKWQNGVVGRLYSVQYKSIIGAPDKVRHDTCDKARPLSQV